MRVLVCGSRNWHRQDMIRDRIAKLPQGTTVIHGGARGADSTAGTYALARGFDVEVWPADWKPDGIYDPGAGHKRNLAMLDSSPDLVIAFQRDGSRGTQHTIDNALKRGITVEVHTA